jgi:hypothetical protein
MILIHTPVVRPRIIYVFRHFFQHRLGQEVSFTSDVGVFVAHSGPKMSYGDVPLGNEFFIAANGLLAHQGVNSVDISVFQWEGMPAFFATSAKSQLPFDFFAASFYLMSRYEEYMPYVPDDLGRFKVEQSLAHNHNFLDLPLIDMWFECFVAAWTDFFELPPFTQQVSTTELVIEIPQLYAYKYKTIFRSFFEGLYDFGRLRFAKTFDRLMVILRFREDPLIGLIEQMEAFRSTAVSFRFFALYAALGIHDKSLSVFSKKHQQELKSLSDYAPTAPLASFESTQKSQKLVQDITRFSGLIHRPIKAIRQHKLVLRFPDTYRTYASLGIKHDYSMQYPDVPGFRASTAHPFRFYDLGEEQQTPLTIHPICLSESHIRAQQYARKMRQLFIWYQSRLQKLHAPLLVALTNESFNSRSKNLTFLATLKKMLIYG